MKRFLWLSVSAVCLYVACRGVDWRQVGAGLGEAKGAYLLATLTLILLADVLRGLRWYLLFPVVVRRRGLRHVFATLEVGYFVNNLVPARGGEVARIVLMGRHNGVSPAGVLATIITERSFDGLLATSIGLLAVWQLADVEFRWMSHLGLVFGAALVALLIAGFARNASSRLVCSLSARLPGRLPGVVARHVVSMLDHLEGISTLTGLLRICSLSAAIWLVELAVCATVGHALGMRLGWPLLGIFVASVSLASLAPTPGGIGTIELIASSTLVAAGVPRESALTLVVVQHSVRYFFCLAFGLYYANRLGFSLSRRCNVGELGRRESSVARPELATESVKA